MAEDVKEEVKPEAPKPTVVKRLLLSVKSDGNIELTTDPEMPRYEQIGLLRMVLLTLEGRR